MIVQIHCQHCGHDFEAEVDGKTTICPACQKETPINSPLPRPKTTIQTPPPPPPPAQEKAEPKAMKPEHQPSLFPVLQLVVLIAITVLLFLIWHGLETNSKGTRWDYAEFEYNGNNSIQDANGTTDNLHLFYDDMMQAYRNGEPNGITNVITSYGVIIDRTGLLSVIGHDGWELAWTDGTHYIVKRPEGQWRHDGFFLAYSTNRD